MTLLRRLKNPNPPARIEIVPIGKVDASVLEVLCAELPTRFAAPVRPGAAMTLRSAWYEASREQYQADGILDALVTDHGGDGWVLGVADADLYVPGLNFIFGQATVGGCCAVIGLARLRDEFYGEVPRLERFRHRVLIEAVHELGHVAGLDHCPDPSCVMHFSETIGDTDRKGADFCPRCAG